MSVTETYHGFVETTQDTLLIFEACRRGLLPRVCRRLHEKERRLIRSGTVFVFDERESGIKRWTDGLVWSPSRILGNFLLYRELDKRNGQGKRELLSLAQRPPAVSLMEETCAERERQLVGSLTNSYHFKKNGLIKKTISIVVHGVCQHLVSYYTIEDVISGRLRTPSSVPELASLEISPELLLKQNFRVPPLSDPSSPTSAGSLYSSYHDQPLGTHPIPQQSSSTPVLTHPSMYSSEFSAENKYDANGRNEFDQRALDFYYRTQGYTTPSASQDIPNRGYSRPTSAFTSYPRQHTTASMQFAFGSPSKDLTGGGGGKEWNGDSFSFLSGAYQYQVAGDNRWATTSMETPTTSTSASSSSASASMASVGIPVYPSHTFSDT
ncbi:uncharacterized protein VTP21DRAFT_1484 [Calcarisporiella thermophila]|uniref:uncharacterized protein n=1 Tax=Calcarisporiella thermophila TaxID=911321 RepID=UPI00374474CA